MPVHRGEVRMRHFLGILLRSCSRFNQLSRQAVASRSLVTLQSQREKKWETLFSMRGRWCPTCKLFNLRFNNYKASGRFT